MRKLTLLALFICLPALAWSYGGYYSDIKSKKAPAAPKGKIAVESADGSIVYMNQPGYVAPANNSSGNGNSKGGGAGNPFQGGIFSGGNGGGFGGGGGGGGFQTNVLTRPKTGGNSGQGTVSGGSVPTGLATAANTSNAAGTGSNSNSAPKSGSATVQSNPSQTPCASGQTMMAGQCVTLPNSALGSGALPTSAFGGSQPSAPSLSGNATSAH